MTSRMVFELLGGLGLFIYGMNIMGAGLQKAAGDRLKRLLEVLTTNRLLGLVFGAVITAIIQSSSATTVMVVGFVNAGLMNLMQAAGVIMGANIGTTVTAQLIAFKLTDIAPVVVAVGVGLLIFGTKRRYRQLGEILTGFGILFIGMNIMSVAMEPLKDSELFANIMTTFGRNKFLATVSGFVVTGIIQSSSASIGLLQALAFNDLIGLDAALPIVLGMNIGTCVTALLSSIGTNINARRAAMIHLTIKVIGMFLFIGFTTSLGNIVKFLGGDTARQIANAHTLYNVVNTAVLLPFASLLVLVSKRLVPGEEDEEGVLKYLDNRLLETPSIAVLQAVKEIVRMGEAASDTLRYAVDGFIKEDEKLLNNCFQKENMVNALEKEITHFLVLLSNSNLSAAENELVTGLFHTVNDIERIGDHAENIAELGQSKIDNSLVFSEVGIRDLTTMADYVHSMVEEVVIALKNRDYKRARDVREREDEVDKMEREYRESHIGRLNNYQCVPGSGVVFLDVISNLERIGDHCSNIALSILDRDI
ncbi:MAG: Na/Pi cotransporter family protein [Clostridia bacterium]